MVSRLDGCVILDPPASASGGGGGAGGGGGGGNGNASINAVGATRAATAVPDSNNRRTRQHRFMLDSVLPPSASQASVYAATAADMLESLLLGHNCTVFAYGATGCGKTHTITGTPQDPGLVFRAVEALFQQLQQSSKITELSLSYLEIYNEQIRDLFQPETLSKKLNLLEVNGRCIKVANLTRVTPVSLDDTFDLIVRGNANRTVSPTQANAVSSRSHAILQINLLQSTNSGLEDEIVESTLNIIDLAGSERAIGTLNTGKTLHEGANINKSLLALGSCISALSEGKPHVPYRNSKLTRLLKYSLGGNCKTCMVVCLAPDAAHFDDSLNALKYANMAKNIKTSSVVQKTVVARHVGDYERTIVDQQRLISQMEERQSQVVAHAREALLGEMENVLSKIDAVVAAVNDSLKSSGMHEQTNQAHLLQARKKDLEALALKLDNHSELVDHIKAVIEQLDDHQAPDVWSFVQDTFNRHRSELENLPGWCSATARVYDQYRDTLLDQYTNGQPTDHVCANLLARMVSSLEELVDRPDANVGLALYGILDAVKTSIGPGEFHNSDANVATNLGDASTDGTTVAPLVVRKRRQHSNSIHTPRKSSRISSLNVQLGDFNIDTTDDSIEQSSPLNGKYGLTTKRLIASPKIHSPNRIAGLGVSYQAKFKGFGVDPEVQPEPNGANLSIMETDSEQD